MKKSNIALTICVFVGFFSSPHVFSQTQEVGTEIQPREVAWENFWKEVEQDNPSVKALKAEVNARESETVEPLPPPQFGIGTTGENSPWSGLMERTFEVSQKIPFPTKFIQAGNVKEKRVELAQTEQEFQVQRLKEKLSELFIRLYETLNEKKFLAEKKQTLQSHLGTLQRITVSSQVQQVHLLGVKGELSLVDNEVRELDFQETQERKELGSYLGNGEIFKDTPILSQDLPEPPTTARSPSRIESKIAVKTESLLDSEKSYATQKWFPDLVFTFRDHHRFDNVMPSSYEFMVGIELPFLWGWQVASQNSYATHLLEKSRFERIQQDRVSLAEKDTDYARLKNLWDQHQTLKNTIIPTYEKQVHLLHRIVPSDMESLDLHRNTLTSYIEQKLKALRIETEYRVLFEKIKIKESSLL